jgi:hypothetical protein
MPRRRRRTTNRKRQDERQLRVRGVRRSAPDATRLSRAFIALALARAEADAQAQAKTALSPSPKGPKNQQGRDANDAPTEQEAGDAAP